MNPFRDLPDEALMARYQRGESMAFDVLYQRHQGRVFGYLRRRLAQETDVHEVFQNSFLKFHRVRHRYNPRYPVLQWLYTITRSELLDFCKRRRIETLPLSEDLAAPEELREGPDLDAVPGLSARERQVIELRFFSDQDYREISQQLELSEANARKILSRGLAKLRRSLPGREGS